MTDIFSRPVSTSRAIADFIVGAVLVAILAGLLILVFIESAERGRYHGDAPARTAQQIPFKGGKT